MSWQTILSWQLLEFGYSVSGRVCEAVFSYVYWLLTLWQAVELHLCVTTWHHVISLRQDTQFLAILQDSLDFFNIPEDEHGSHFLVDTKTRTSWRHCAFTLACYTLHCVWLIALLMRQTHIPFVIDVFSCFRSNAQPELLRQGLLFLSSKLLPTVESCQNEQSRRVKSASSSGSSSMTSCRGSDDASSQLHVPFGSCRRVDDVLVLSGSLGATVCC